MIFINAGHHLKDSGNITQGTTEANATMVIRDELKKILPNLLYVPDNLTLKESIAWVNERAALNDLAIDIHLNANNDINLRGTECYYFMHKDLAAKLSLSVSTALGIGNRGAKPDSQSYVGSLGWLRNTVCKALVLECLYMSNKQDFSALSGGKIALGIKQFLVENSFIPAEEVQPRSDTLKKIKDLLLQLIGLVSTLGGLRK